MKKMKLRGGAKRNESRRTTGSKLIPVLSLALCSLFLIVRLAAQENYANPVIPGDFPDPSAIRVGKDYYATATTGGWSPHFPLLHSTDLVNWKFVGAVFYEKPAWAKGDFWAPEIVADKGRFFVYYTARRDDGKDKKGTLCVAVATAHDPAGPYVDKGPLVCQEMGSIDADFVRDERGRPFLMWKEDGNDRRQPTWLYAQALDESGTRLKGRPVRLFRNTEPWEGNVVEGSFVVRRDGWFYLFYSGNGCCGRECNYALGVARSKTLLGKWEKNPANPILAANAEWQCPGHGSIVETPDDRAFLLYHAYRKSRLGFQIGREALLDEVRFENGWASVNGGKGASGSARTPFENTRQQPIFAGSSDDFGGGRLSAQWSQRLGDFNLLEVSGGFLKLAASKKNQSEAVISERMVTGDYRASAKLDFERLSDGEAAGLAVSNWRGGGLGISVASGRVFVWEKRDGVKKELSETPLPAGIKTARLAVRAANAADYDFYFSFDENANWQKLGGTIDGRFIEGGRVSLVHEGNAAANAKFDWLRVDAP